MSSLLIQRGEFLAAVGENATALCPDHAQSFAITAMLLDLDPTVYEIPDSEPPVACQACFMIHRDQPGV